MIDYLKPKLIEDNVKYFLGQSLNNCHNFKEHYFSNIYNIAFFIGFILLIGIILFFNYKGNKSAKEIRIKQQRDKEHIILKLLKIKRENIDDRKMRNNLITNLPIYNQNI
tara:strand:- start:221 stop:550 length:330 start_codon:yes stop_codon:yes gene_type:complete